MKKDDKRPGWEKLGYVRFWRGFKDDPIWKKGGRYCRTKAWLDLYSDARGVPGYVMFNKKSVPLERGQLVISQLTLAHRWNWSRNSVRHFLSYLVRRGTIAIKTIPRSGGYSVLTFINYGELNPVERKLADDFQGRKQKNGQ